MLYSGNFDVIDFLIHLNCYYFLQVPYLPTAYLAAKRGVVQERFPGPVEVTFGDFEPESKLVGDLGADLEDFMWVDGPALLHTLVNASTLKGLRRNVVSFGHTSRLELDRALVDLLLADAGVIDAIARVVAQ